MSEGRITTAEILTVGTEILMGQIVNTNASYLACRLRDLGISCYYQSTCGDNHKRMSELLLQAAERSDCVLISGGLGPTEDDISMAVAAECAGLELIYHPDEFAKIENYFRSLGRTTSANNRKQAMLPEGAVIIPNDNGTAPGAMFWSRRSSTPCLFVLLPGPPNENHPMFRQTVAPYLEAHADYKFRNRFVRMIGIGESDAEMLLHDLIEGQENPTLAPYCSTGEVMFRITQRYQDESEADLTELMLDRVRERVGSYIYEVGERHMHELVSDLLREKAATLVLAESCTGGMMADQLTSIAGASDFFLGSIVSYANSIKSSVLGVESHILETEGAVSEACVQQMAEHAARMTGADYAVAVSGIAGPGGGTIDKPVGTVFIAVAGGGETLCRRFQFRGRRNKIRVLTTLNAFNLLRERLIGKA